MFDLQGFGHLLLTGSILTIKLALASLALGMIFGLLGATMKLSSIRVFRWIATLYTTVMRGIPELLLIMFLYFGTLQLSNYLRQFGINFNLTAFEAGVFALSVAFGAYATEVLRMAIQDIPEGQWEAGKSIGLHPLKIVFRIILPQVWSLALPGLGNLFLVTIKDTALISLIGLKDLMYFAKRGGQSTHLPFTFFMSAALLYLAMTVVVTGVMMFLEWRADPAKRYSAKLKKNKTQSAVA